MKAIVRLLLTMTSIVQSIQFVTTCFVATLTVRHTTANLISFDLLVKANPGC
ncbi:protein of unknown function [Candidatus Promineifilum breve]|uniref:Uncharacterized protein n=1 Tax=Candidatus Promineifilum breve TaxID=1806508 RepID=A0A160T6V7_9CHLR|nr:protein of unknown function [Candidatus Promineifilum breve]